MFTLHDPTRFETNISLRCSALKGLHLVHSFLNLSLFQYERVACSFPHKLFYFESQKYMPRRKTGEEMNFTYVECLLYTFHHIAYKVISALQSYSQHILRFFFLSLFAVLKLLFLLFNRLPMPPIVYAVTRL